MTAYVSNRPHTENNRQAIAITTKYNIVVMLESYSSSKWSSRHVMVVFFWKWRIWGRRLRRLVISGSRKWASSFEPGGTEDWLKRLTSTRWRKCNLWDDEESAVENIWMRLAVWIGRIHCVRRLVWTSVRFYQVCPFIVTVKTRLFKWNTVVFCRLRAKVFNGWFSIWKEIKITV